MEEMTIWEQHTATIYKVRHALLRAWGQPLSSAGRGWSNSPACCSRRTPAEVLALPCPEEAATDPVVAPWWCPTWCLEAQPRAGYSEFWAAGLGRAMAAAWHLPARSTLARLWPRASPVPLGHFLVHPSQNAPRVGKLTLGPEGLSGDTAEPL